MGPFLGASVGDPVRFWLACKTGPRDLDERVALTRQAVLALRSRVQSFACNLVMEHVTHEATVE